MWKGEQWRCLNANERLVILGFPKGYLDAPKEPLTEDAKCELAGDVMATKVISRLLASLPEAPGAWPPLPLAVSEGKIVAKEDDADYSRDPDDEPQSRCANEAKGLGALQRMPRWFRSLLVTSQGFVRWKLRK